LQNIFSSTTGIVGDRVFFEPVMRNLRKKGFFVAGFLFLKKIWPRQKKLDFFGEI